MMPESKTPYDMAYAEGFKDGEDYTARALSYRLKKLKTEGFTDQTCDYVVVSYSQLKDLMELAEGMGKA